MNVGDSTDLAVAKVASAIGEHARSRILFCLMDGHARTGTELAIVAGVNPSTASVHLARLKHENLVSVLVQGKHRYYSLHDSHVASALEALAVVAGARHSFQPSTPLRLRNARTCYDHMAGTVSVLLHDRLKTIGWLNTRVAGSNNVYDVTGPGAKNLESLGIDLEETRMLRRRFAFACLDWSERKPHIGGALGAAILKMLLRRRWAARDLDSRVLSITRLGQREFRARFDLEI
jgi:DNA-binding transcriptional ArsR family regulator